MIYAQLKGAWDTEQLRIHMHRKEYEAAVAVLTRGRYPLTAWESHYELQTAKRLENRFPEEILKYYVSGLGNMKTKAVRKEYTQKAKVMAKIRHLLVEVLNDKARWRAVFVNKDVRLFIQAAFGSYDRSPCNSFGGFSHTSETGSQFRVLPDQRAGFRFFAAS